MDACIIDEASSAKYAITNREEGFPGIKEGGILKKKEWQYSSNRDDDFNYQKNFGDFKIKFD